MKNYLHIKIIIFSDSGLLVLIALAWLVFLTVVSAFSANQYGFHRDELAFLNNANHLAWGYVEYPPFTPWWPAWGWTCSAGGITQWFQASCQLNVFSTISTLFLNKSS